MNIVLLIVYFFVFIYCQNPIQNDIDSANAPKDIDLLSIAYELTYDNSSVVKTIIRVVNEIEHEIKFNARLRGESGKDYRLSCHNSSSKYIDCLSEKVEFDLNDKYYFYYKKGEDGEYTIEGKDIYEDYKNISLIFKPEIYDDQILYKENKNILGSNNKISIGGGYLYLAPKSKQLLSLNKDGFNKYIELNNFISHAGLLDQKIASTLSAYKEVIRRGFHIVEADIQFTKDKIPVICHEKDLGKVSDGNGNIESKTLTELQKLNFGYTKEKILTFDSLLKLCRENNVIIDLNFIYLDYKKYFEESDDYMKMILKIIEKNNMLDSIYFDGSSNPNTILKLQKLKKDISVSVSIIDKKDKEQIKDKYKNFKRVIINIGEISEDNNHKKEIEFYKSLGYKIKAGIVDDIKFAEKIQSWGVNYITTNKIHPFLIKNEKEYPFLLKCIQFDHLADCNPINEVKLIDHEIYNIYYSENIYNMNEDINTTPLGECIYLDTRQSDHYYYDIRYFDFDKGIIGLNTSVRIDIGEQLNGTVGPTGYIGTASEYYQYNFICNGNGTTEVSCSIFKDDNNKIRFGTNYSIYSIENYSVFFEPTITQRYPRLDINNTFDSKFEELKDEGKIMRIVILVFLMFGGAVLAYNNLMMGSYQNFKEVKTMEN